MGKAKPVKAAAAAAPAKVLNGVKSGKVTKSGKGKVEVTKSPASKKELSKRSRKAPTPSDSEDSSDDSAEDDSEESSDSETEAKVKAKPKAAAPAAKTNGTKNAKKDEKDSSSEDDDSSDEDAPAAKANGVNGTAAAADTSDADSDSDASDDSEDSVADKAAGFQPDSDADDSEDSDSDSEAEKPAANVKAAAGAADAGDSADDAEESDESSSDEDEEEKPKAAEPKKRKADEPAEPASKKAKIDEGADDQAGSKTLFVGRLSWNVDEDGLYKEFEEFGEVVSCRIMYHQDSGKSKGFGYVEFGSVAEATAAKDAKHGTMIDGREVNVDFSTPRAEKPKPSFDERAKKYGDVESPASDTLFVGNISFEATYDDIKNTFEEYGTITRISLPTDRESGAPKGFGYVGYSSIEEAQAAMTALRGSDIAGRPIRLDYATARADDGGQRGGRGGGRGFGGDRGGRGRGGRGGFNDRGGRGGRGGGGRGGGFDRGRGRGGFNRGGFGDFQGKKTSF